MTESVKVNGELADEDETSQLSRRTRILADARSFGLIDISIKCDNCLRVGHLYFVRTGGNQTVDSGYLERRTTARGFHPSWLAVALREKPGK